MAPLTAKSILDVTEGSAVHRVDHGAASLPFGGPIIDPDRSAVSIAFDMPAGNIGQQLLSQLSGY